MEFSWTICVAAIMANLAWILVMFVAQQLDKSLPPRNSIIPGTHQKFIYVQDFWTMTWGDIVGVSLIWVAFFHVVVNWFGPYCWVFFWLVSLIVAWYFMQMCLSTNHKPDWGYPEIGKISMSGYLHLPYFGCSVVAGVWCLGLFTVPGIVLVIYLTGLAIYGLCFLLEIRSGNFDSLENYDPNKCFIGKCSNCGREFSKQNPNFGWDICCNCWANTNRK